jgi:rhamnosyltransferase
VKSFKVAAYITAYEDNRAVEACVTALKKQSFPVDKIFIVDNSISQPVVLPNYEDVIVESHPENLGVSGGLRLGIKWAIEQNYDFLWVFDQDSIPTATCLEVLLTVYKNLSQPNYQPGIIAATPIDTRTNQVVEGAVFERDRFIACQHTEIQPYECEAPITSGSLISIAAAKSISLPCPDLFIDGVDFEYGLRLKQKGFYNLIVPQAVLYHKFGNPMKVKLLQKERVIHKYTALRYYYMLRNHTYLESRYAQGWYRLTSYLYRTKYMLRTIVVILLYDPKAKGLKIWACFRGTYHGLAGKLGKKWH